MMLRRRIFISKFRPCLLGLSLMQWACIGNTSDQIRPQQNSLDEFLQPKLKTHKIQGLALAIVRDGHIELVRSYGVRNKESRQPLNKQTIMYAASFTKTAFAYFFLKLVESGRITLDTPLNKILPKPLHKYSEFSDLKDDPRWKKLTPRILLGHASGFQNYRWIDDDKKLRFYFEPGTRYGYSGEGYHILQLAIEQGLGVDVAHEMRQKVFSPLGMSRSNLLWRASFEHNYADTHDNQGRVIPYSRRTQVSAAGSMASTIEDQARFWQNLINTKGLSLPLYKELGRPQYAIISAHQFPTLRAPKHPENRSINLSAGLGLVTFNGTKGLTWFKGGHDDGTGNFAICITKEKDCVILMSNDVRAERIFPAVVNFILGDTGMPWRWEYSWYE